jgi:hypothetical protein
LLSYSCRSESAQSNNDLALPLRPWAATLVDTGSLGALFSRRQILCRTFKSCLPKSFPLNLSQADRLHSIELTANDFHPESSPAPACEINDRATAIEYAPFSPGREL